MKELLPSSRKREGRRGGKASSSQPNPKKAPLPSPLSAAKAGRTGGFSPRRRRRRRREAELHWPVCARPLLQNSLFLLFFSPSSSSFAPRSLRAAYV